MKRPRRVVVVGTGTDVGKTHVVESLLLQARALGLRVVGYKPVATGVVGRCDDALRHAAAAGEPYSPPSFSYERPVSPHLAARAERRPIDLEVIRQRADVLGDGLTCLLIESAGGLFSPLSETETNVDLVRSLAPDVVLCVAPDRLGVLHEVRALRLAARAKGVDLDALVLSVPPALDASTGTNAAELDALGLGPVRGVFPREPPSDLGSQRVAADVWRQLWGEV